MGNGKVKKERFVIFNCNCGKTFKVYINLYGCGNTGCGTCDCGECRAYVN